jgi:hypothetical protein
MFDLTRRIVGSEKPYKSLKWPGFIGAADAERNACCD